MRFEENRQGDKLYVCIRNVPLGNYSSDHVICGSDRVLAKASGEGTGSPR